MKGIMIHCGGKYVSYDELRKVETPRATRSWNPYPYHRLVDSVQSLLGEHDLRSVHHKYAISRDGDRFFGLMQIRNGVDSDDYGNVLGLRASHDKSLSTELAAGTGVFVCDNMSFCGSEQVKRKHTTHVERDLKKVVGKALAACASHWVDQAKRIEVYKETKLSRKSVHDIVVKAMLAGAIPNTKVPEVLAEYENPTYEDFRPRTGWSLHNAFTEVMKKNQMRLNLVQDRTLRLTGLLDQELGVHLAKK